MPKNPLKVVKEKFMRNPYRKKTRKGSIYRKLETA